MITRPGSRLTHPRRAGTSLLEVLVALGIMAIGALGAFVLFPLSAINMSRALIDDRATTCAITADGQIRDVHKRYVVEYDQQFGPGTSQEPYWRVLEDNGGAPNEPSVPVVVDPMGRAARSGISQIAIGDDASTGIPRTNLGFIQGSVNPSLQALRFCSQMDGLTYAEGGDVDKSTYNTSTMRELRYNWMWVLQRPINRDKYTVRQQVVVFDKRVHLYAPAGSEAVYRAVFTPGTTFVYGIPNTAEGVRKGLWIMDATVRSNVDGDGATRLLRHAEFYRVTSVTERTTDNTYVLELHKPIVRADGLVDRLFTPDTTQVPNIVNTNTYAYTGSLVVMPTAIEVFERPPLTGNAQ